MNAAHNLFHPFPRPFKQAGCNAAGRRGAQAGVQPAHAVPRAGVHSGGHAHLRPAPRAVGRLCHVIPHPTGSGQRGQAGEADAAAPAGPWHQPQGGWIEGEVQGGWRHGHPRTGARSGNGSSSGCRAIQARVSEPRKAVTRACSPSSPACTGAAAGAARPTRARPRPV